MSASNNREIERKFLVKSEFKSLASKHYVIKQGYIATFPKTVRIRIRGEKGFITIKGKTGESKLSRFEWEKEIALNDAEELLQLCEKGIIDKTRYEVIYDGKTFEVDEFHGENEGLIMAELELETEDETFSLPDWIGDEVTGDIHYYNSYLSHHPYKDWDDRIQI